MSQTNISAIDLDFDTALKAFLAGKRKVSSNMHRFLQCLVILFTSCAVAMAASYATQLGETLLFKVVIIATAVGIEAAVVFFSAIIYPRWVLWMNQMIAGTLLPLLSLFTVMSFMISQQFAQDHKVEVIAKAYVQNLQEDAGKLSASNKQDRSSLAVTRNRIEKMFDRLEDTDASKATAVYHYLSKTFLVPVETTVLLIRFLWGLCFVSLCIALDAYVDLRLYSKNQLNTFIKEWDAERILIKEARDNARKRTKDDSFQPTLANQGTRDIHKTETASFFA